jgi:phosphoglucosamine mutase
LVVFPQILENIQVTENQGIEDNELLREAVRESEVRMAGKGRVLIRASGTEPLIRVMVEGECEEMIRNEVNVLIKIVKSEFS